MAAGDALDIVKAALRISRYDDSRTADQVDGLYWLNDCHRALLTGEVRWPFLNATGQADLAAGSQRYTFTSLATALGVSAIERILWVVNDTTGGSPLKGMDSKTLERLAYSTQDDPSSEPIAFAQLGLGTSAPSVLFYPTPDRAYKMGFNVRRTVVDLANADVPLIPGAHAPAVLTPYIAARMWNQRAGSDAAAEADRHDLRHERAVQNLVRAYGTATEEDITFIEPGLYDYLDVGGGSW